MTSQTVLFNRLPSHLSIRAKRQSRRIKFEYLRDAVLELRDRTTVEGYEFWNLVLYKIISGDIKVLTPEEEHVYNVLKTWTDKTFGYRRLVRRTGMEKADLKKILTRLRALEYIRKEGTAYITLK